MAVHLQRTHLIKLLNDVQDLKVTTADAVDVILTHISENYELQNHHEDEEQ